MYATGAFKNPFADFDFTKIAADFKMPSMNIESFVETGRKNFAALTAANTSAVESIKAIAQRQGVSVEQAMQVALSANVQHRILEPEELGGMVALLTGDEGAGITGQVLSVDGGLDI